MSPFGRQPFTVGFTGSRRMMTGLQLEQVGKWLDTLRPERACHGDCVGSDTMFHYEAINRTILTCIHPPSKPDLRSFCKGQVTADPKPYLQRNLDIIDHAEIIIATPFGPEAKAPRSGTWFTIRRAREDLDDGELLSLYIVYPDGTVDISGLEPEDARQLADDHQSCDEE